MITEAPITHTQEQQLKSLIKHRHLNTMRIGRLLLCMVKAREGGVNEKNTQAVLAYLSKKISLSLGTLRQYLEIGMNLKLPEVFDMPTRAAHLAWCLTIEDQRRLVVDGVQVVLQRDEAPVVMKLHEFNNDEAGSILADRVINAKMCRIRDPKAQREYMARSVPGKRDELIIIWPNDWVRVTSRIPLADLAYLVKQLKAKGFGGASDSKIRSQLDAELAKLFPPSQGASPA